MSVKISNLTAATTVADADLIPIVQGGTTKKATLDLVLDQADARVDNTFGEGSSNFSSTLENNFDLPVSNPLKIIIAGYDNKAVYFRGQLDCSLVTFTPNTFIRAFRLNSNARPISNMYFPICSENSVAMCKVQSDGYVYIKDVTGDIGADGIIDLGNVSYYRDPF